MITATAITEKFHNRGQFLQPTNSGEEVTGLYFKTPLYGTDEGIAVVDIIGSLVLYFLNRRNKKGKKYSGGSLDYNVSGNSPMIRRAKIIRNKQGVVGWNDCRGRFHKI